MPKRRAYCHIRGLMLNPFLASALLLGCSDNGKDRPGAETGGGAERETGAAGGTVIKKGAQGGDGSVSLNGIGGAPTGGSQAGAGGIDTSAGRTGTAGTVGGAAGICIQFGTPKKVGQFDNNALVELSGIAASRSQSGVLYAHSDSGSAAVFYAFSVSGSALGTFTLSGSSATDWEDIAVGPSNGSGNFVYIGDIGDNAAREGFGVPRAEIEVFRVAEPSVSIGANVGQVSLTGWEKLSFKYPDKAHDAETLMVDPISSDILIVTKENDGRSKVFRALGSTSTNAVTVLEEVATLALGTAGQDNARATAGDISPSGDRILVRTYRLILLWRRGASWSETFSAKPIELPSADEPKGEGLTFSADGRGWFSAGEGSNFIYGATEQCP